MHKLLSFFLAKPVKTPSRNAAADHWSQWQAQTDAQQPRWIDWGEHPLFLSLIQEQLFGSADISLFRYLQDKHPALCTASALSLCSGDGAFENQLVRSGVFAAITGMDISPVRVEKAQQQHAGSGANLSFTVGDVNAGRYGIAQYDVVFAKAALHHIENLEAAFAGMQACLRPGGYLVTIDFFGPSRFQWTNAQLDLANELLTALPPALRTGRDGVVKTTIERPTVNDMIAADPSEAVRSSEIHGFIERGFNILEELDIGGTVFNLVFTPEILANVDPDNVEHRQLVTEIFTRERRMIDSGQLPSDFKFIIARQKGLAETTGL